MQIIKYLFKRNKPIVLTTPCIIQYLNNITYYKMNNNVYLNNNTLNIIDYLYTEEGKQLLNDYNNIIIINNF